LENIIDTYRNRIKAMGYEPRRQEDIPDVMAAYCEAIANCKIEGLELVSDDHSFCLLLVETQIPVDVAIGLAQDYNRDVLSRQSWESATIISSRSEKLSSRLSDMAGWFCSAPRRRRTRANIANCTIICFRTYMIGRGVFGPWT